MKTNRRNALKTVALAGTAAVAAPAVARAEEIRWRMATSWPKNLPGPGVTAQRLVDRIGALSGGRLQVKLYAAGELVPALEVLDGVATGTVHMGHTAAVFWTGKMPAAPFFLAIPFGMTPQEHVTWIEHGGGQALWDELYGDFGVKPFMAGNTGMSMGGWFRKELTSLDDLQGLKFRMPGLGGQMYAPFGIVQVSLSPGETQSALQTGLIDAAEFAGPSSDLALGFYKVTPHYYGPGIHEPNGTGECIVNIEAFNALPDDLQAIVAEACRAEAAFALAEAEHRNALALAALVNEHGVQLRRFPQVIIDAARVSANDVLAGFEAMGGIEARIYQSYTDMQRELTTWSRTSLEDFLGARTS